MEHGSACGAVQIHETGAQERRRSPWHQRCELIHWTGGVAMLMFKRSQLYLGLALAGLFEIIVRVVY
jgi:hypothetical protein